jgi:hypothetical protein
LVWAWHTQETLLSCPAGRVMNPFHFVTAAHVKADVKADR